MSDKTKEELVEELIIKCKLEDERAISDARYAWQRDFDLVRKIVFTMVGTITIGFLLSLLTRINWK
jgi:hypothetical protein